MIERRASDRADVAVSAEVHTGKETLAATTENLSPSGVGLIIDRLLPEGALVGLQLFLVVDEIEDSSTNPVTVTGQVAWSVESEDGVFKSGVHFVQLDESHEKAVAAFLHHLGSS